MKLARLPASALCLVLAAPLAACREEGPVVPATITRHIMNTAVEPAAKVVFEAAAEPPRDDAGWRQAQASAGALADSAGRLIKAVRGGEKAAWIGQAKGLAGAAEQAAAAAAAKDAEALATAGEALYQSCENCHRAFQAKRVADK